MKILLSEWTELLLLHRPRLRTLSEVKLVIDKLNTFTCLILGIIIIERAHPYVGLEIEEEEAELYPKLLNGIIEKNGLIPTSTSNSKFHKRAGKNEPISPRNLEKLGIALASFGIEQGSYNLWQKIYYFDPIYRFYTARIKRDCTVTFTDGRIRGITWWWADGTNYFFCQYETP